MTLNNYAYMANNNNPSKIETSLFADVLQILQAARQKAYSAVNSEMVQAYGQKNCRRRTARRTKGKLW